MKIQNKYLRNKHFRIKHWKRIRRQENPYEYTHGAWFWTHEEQVKRNLEYIKERARCLESGGVCSMDSTPSGFRRQLNKISKARLRHAMARINMGDWDYEVPFFKRDAAWLYW